MIQTDCLAGNSSLTASWTLLAFAGTRSIVAAVALLLVLLLPLARMARAQKPAPHADYVVAQPVVDMLARPAADSDVTSQALYGTGVQSIEKQGDWIRIRTADDYTGWVAARDLRPLSNTSYPAEGRLVQVAALAINVYREPDVTKHAPLLRLPWEARLESLPDAAGDNERWLAVKLVDGQTAWVQHGDVTTRPQPLNIDEMLDLAHRFMGITYTWGGVSSFGFDCSGFTQMLVRQRGIEMPRDADVQAAWSGVTVVERKDLQPGDLLFFGASTDKITHTGMYIGTGQFIHDTTHDKPGVQISRLDDEHWTHLFVAARRVKP
jgi:cell wall-associated NlpC family hydrolase